MNAIGSWWDGRSPRERHVIQAAVGVLILALALLALVAAPLRAENVDLSTVPSRSSVQLTI